MEGFVRFGIRFVMGAAMLCFISCDVSGQSTWGGVVRIEANGGGGTGFSVKANAETVEIWTAGHVSGPVGSEAVVFFSGNRKSIGIVASRSYDGKGDGEDQAKIVCPRPDGEVATIPICKKNCNVVDFAYFSGFSLGPQSQRQVQITMTPDLPFPSRLTARPAPDHGDSGGPVINGNGEVIGVVTSKTVERVPRLLFIPISRWVDE